MAIDLPERATGGFLGRGGETDEEYRQRLSWAASDALEGVKIAYAQDLDNLALENRIIKQQQAASERLTARAMEREAALQQAQAAERAAQTKLTQIEAAFQIVGRGDELYELMDAYHAKRLPQQQVQRSTQAIENDLTPQQIAARARERDDGWER